MADTLHNVLIIGSGGREHALVNAVAASPLLGELYAAPGNSGMLGVCECIALSDQDAIAAFVKAQAIDLVIVGPEQPLTEGLADRLKGLCRIIGPDAAAAQLEGSKSFMKEVAAAAGVPTAAYTEFTDPAAALAHVTARNAPMVVKADGLAAGKGVTVADTREQAAEAVRDCLEGNRFGDAGAKVIIEDCMTGPEVSAFYLIGEDDSIRFIGAAQDHKRLLDDDKGPNTGGMGTFSPSPLFTDELEAFTRSDMIAPTLSAMRRRGSPFTGFLFAGLMLTPDGPKLLEYNVRMGDPETQSLLPLLSTDLLAAFLDDTAPIATDPARAAVTVVLAAPGYPDAPVKGGVIASAADFDAACALTNTEITVAGAKLEGDQWIVTGGRVLGVTGFGTTLQGARKTAYAAAHSLNRTAGLQLRSDIASTRKIQGL